MRVLFGGNFDPVHVGHIALARHLLRSGAEVCVLVSVNPPFRSAPKASVSERKAMLARAFEGQPRLTIESVNDYCESPYTIDLLRAVRRRVGEAVPLAWAMGSDQYAKLNTWREWTQLVRFAHLLVFQREGGADAIHADVTRRLGSGEGDLDAIASAPAGQVVRMAPRLPRASSTEIRERIGAGKSVQGLAPQCVRDYVALHGLYRAVAP